MKINLSKFEIVPIGKQGGMLRVWLAFSGVEWVR